LWRVGWKSQSRTAAGTTQPPTRGRLWLRLAHLSGRLILQQGRLEKIKGIRYYLDANKSVKEQAYYRIKIEGDKVPARLLRIA